MLTVSKSTAPQSPRHQSRKSTDIDIRIGQLIRERRRALSMTQDDLAKSLGIAQHQLQKYETGENRISASRLVELARTLEVAITWFYQWTDAHVSSATMALGDADESALIETFRDLTPAGRAQLVGIAAVLRGEKTKPSRRNKRT
jgi:transcriptional regulator with XRE-family HTH domain